VAVTELLTGPSAAAGIPHVTGVRTSDGGELSADLVIDAMGRRSGLPSWLTALGARPLAQQAEDSGFTYYSRYFRSLTGNMPQFMTGLLTPFHTFSLLALPSDSATWSVTVYISSRDQALKELGHVEKWTALIAACPLHAHLLNGKPLTGVLAMSGIVDRSRRLVVDGTPVVTGLVTVGDSACCTNPSLGRGVAMGLLHAAGTVEVIGKHLADPLTLAAEHDHMTRAELMPWYRATVDVDRTRKAQLDAAIEGSPVPQPADPAAQIGPAVETAMVYDADIFRGMMEIMTMQTLPKQVFARPGFVDRALAVAGSHESFAAPGPSRAELLGALA